jgi:hypothetical protein
MSYVVYIQMSRDSCYLHKPSEGHNENPGNLLRSACRILHPDIVYGNPQPSGIIRFCAYSLQPDSRVYLSHTIFFWAVVLPDFF